MSLLELAVRRPQLMLVLFAMLVALGIHALREIPRAEDPVFPIAYFIVTAVLPGADPERLERLVVDPLEERLHTLDGIERLASRIEDGISTTVIEFEAEADADRKFDEVVREVTAVRSELPVGLQALEVQKADNTRVAILQIAILSEQAPWRQLRWHAEQLEDRLEALPGVKEVRTWAYPDPEIRVELDPERLIRLAIPTRQVLEALQAGNAALAGAGIDVGRRRLTVGTDGGYATVEDVRRTVVASDGTRLALLEDLGPVEWAYAEQTHLGRVDGRRAVFVTVQQKEDANIFEARDRVLAEVEAFRPTLDWGCELEVVFDQSLHVARRLEGLVRDFGLAIALVLVTLLPLGLRASLIVMVSIPLSLAIGISLLYAAGHTINQLSIVGFVIALGVLVDDSIVVTENVMRFLRAGHPRREAAIQATRQIGVAVFGCTATLMLAFVPLLFLPGASGRFIRCLPLAVLFTIAASLLVSLTVIPFFASVALRAERPEGNAVFRAFQRAIERLYRPLLRMALARPFATLAVAAAISLASLPLVWIMGASLFPKAGLPQFLVNIRGPEGSSLAETDRAARFAEEALAERPEIERVITNVGRGNPRIYYNVAPPEEKSNVGQLLVVLRERELERTAGLLEELRAEFATFPGARIELEEFANGPPLRAPVEIEIFAEEFPVLRGLAGEVEQALERTQGTRYVENPLRLARTGLGVVIDSPEAGRLGIAEVEIKEAVRMALVGVVVGRLRDGAGDEHDIRVTLRRDARRPIDALDAVTVGAPSGAQVPLRQVARVEFRASPPRLEHIDRLRSATVTADVATGHHTDRVSQAVIGELGGLEWPAGTSWRAAGEFESREKSFAGLGSAILIAVFGVMAVLVLEFGTFKSTLIVASVIPLGVTGGLLGLLVVGERLSFIASVGFVALLGIEVKNSILLVDFTNQLRARGVPLDEAIESAGKARFFPVVLTTLTALGGLLPLALEGSPIYSPLAVVVIGGLLSSTLLARLVTPVLYKLLAPEVEVDERGTDPAAPAAARSAAAPG